MKNLLKADFRKLLSVRATYFIAALTLVILGVVAFYGYGYKDGAGLHGVYSPSSTLQLAGTLPAYAGFISFFGAITVLLLFANEYRYNTIYYTLTAANSRSKVLVSKLLVSAIYLLVFGLVLGTLALAATALGAIAGGSALPYQHINYLTYMGKLIFSVESYGMAALLFVGLIRNQIGALVTLLVIPGPVEGLLGALLKTNATYLPFTALSQVVQPPVIAGTQSAPSPLGDLSPVKGGVVFLGYLLIGWIVAWVLFLRRDAN